MPDFDRSAGDVGSERLERSPLRLYPTLDHGLSLLHGGAHSPSGGRKQTGGIMKRQGYKGPTVNIRPPKWTDNKFWIKADNLNDAMYITDAVFYHIGREPFHFKDMAFQYPPLRLATCELLTREACAVYVESIAKGPEHLKQREYFRDQVKELVLKAVKSPEAVLFLSSQRPSASSDRAVVEGEIAYNANESGGAEEDSEDGAHEDAMVEEGANESAMVEEGANESAMVEEGANESAMVEEDVVDAAIVGNGLAYQATPMEVDSASKQPTQVVSEPVVATTGYIATFGFSSASLESILESILESDFLDAGCYRSGKQAEVDASFGNFHGLLSLLDKEEEEAFQSVDRSAWTPWCSPRNH